MLVTSVPYLTRWPSDHSRRDDSTAPLWCEFQEGEAIRASTVSRIPTLPEFDVDAEEVDAIQVILRHGNEDLEAERRILSTILREDLGVDPTTEFVGSPQTEVQLGDDDFADACPEEVKRLQERRDTEER